MKTLDQIIASLPAERRAQIAARAKQLIAQERRRVARMKRSAIRG